MLKRSPLKSWGRKRARMSVAKKTPYNGVIYASALEQRYAVQLDWRKKAGDIAGWRRQVKKSLDVNDVHICNYYVDFEIDHLNGSTEAVEVKGFETQLWVLKARLYKALNPDHPLTIVREVR